ncbi:M20 family metallopeptidase [Limibacillus halophilus]|uniref:Acetylornithine deacetylase/succinyl-diaminopimelate desuccinylase-like protein n=1 Tax=Limibacillus halophilus TaxID=1579333 RepID=A0A839SWN4_9PROT|nr:M20 family metallopeptidase [Limibacillus halophilus]MBB3066718.1 acetylornithine deacetylase/succinyl-diaminopimelate desuccinylase-like protein [Limibacillus halophilus]
MTRKDAIDASHRLFDSGEFTALLAKRIAIPSTSQEEDKRWALAAYVREEMGPYLEAMGFTWRIHENPAMAEVPFLTAERIEDPALPTVLTYGHCDTVRGMEGRWAGGRDPWTLTCEGERLYGRGTADNKAQHSLNLAALKAVLALRGGHLGFNVKVLLESGEEVGSPGLRAFCEAEADRLASDIFIASDGPRVRPDLPTLFGGSRGALNFFLHCDLREGAHHSGNWGGLLANPGTILANAIASLIGPQGEIRVPELRIEPGEAIRGALWGLPLPGVEGGLEPDTNWGEPGTTPIERVIAYNALEVLAYETGTPHHPVNAIPGKASAACQLRFVADCDWRGALPAIERHLNREGFERVKVEAAPETVMPATRMDPDHPLMRWAASSLRSTTGRPPAVLPNLGGSIPNDCFMEALGLPTVWVPHSYAACSQHAPNEHVLAPVLREALGIMAGLWWDLGEADATALTGRE